MITNALSHTDGKTNALSEQTFSPLKQIKTYLWSAAYLSHQNQMTLLHGHNEQTNNINLVKTGKEFVSNSASRQWLFGTFKRIRHKSKHLF